MKILSKRTFSILEAYGMYLITGMVCVCVGSSLSSLMEHFQVTLSKAAALSSAFALGRVATVFISGMITERLGPRFSVAAGVTSIIICMGILPVETNYNLALLLMVIAGFGMGVQDSVCPVLIYSSFPDRYSSAMSAGQAVFGAGCFFPPFFMSLLLSSGHSWKWLYYVIFLFGIIMLIGIPFMGKMKESRVEEAKKERSIINDRKRIPLFLILLSVVFVYFANCNIFHTYMVSYVTYYIGKEEIAVNVLTMYSIGVMLGSLIFTKILKWIHTTTAIVCNTCLVTVFLFIAMQLKSTLGFLVFFTLIGMFNGVLFSILVTTSTEIIPNHAAIAASVIGFVGGISEMIAPLVTGNIINKTDITGAFKFNLIIVFVTFLTGYLLRLTYKRARYSKVIIRENLTQE